MKRKEPRAPRGAKSAAPTSAATRPLPDDVLPARLSSLLLLGATLVVAAVLSADLVLTDRRLGFPSDDVFVHLRMAELLTQGGGFSLAPGEAAASASPLWLLLLALPTLMGMNAMAAALILSASAYVLCVHATARLAQRLARRSDVAACVGVAGLCAGPLLGASLSGDVGLPFAVLMLWALDAAVVDARETGATRSVGLRLGLLLGAAALMRPEGLWLGAGVLLLGCLRGEPARLGSPAWRGVVGFAAVALPYYAFAMATTGSPWPAPAASLAPSGDLGGYLASMLSDVFLNNYVLLLVVPVGLFALARGLLRDGGARVAVLSFVAAMGLPYLLGVEARTPLSPLPVCLGLVIGALGLSFVLQRFKLAEESRKPVLRLALMAVFGGGVLGGISATRALAADALRTFNLEMHVGFWAQKHAQGAGRIAADPAGAVAYLSKRPVLDLRGRHSGLGRTQRTDDGRTRDERAFEELVRSKPDVLIVRPAEWPDLTARPDVFEPAFWRKTDATMTTAADRLVAYKALWEKLPKTSKTLSRPEAYRALADARLALSERKADEAFVRLRALEEQAPLDRALRQRLYVTWAQAALERGDCAQAQRAVLYLDWLEPPDALKREADLASLEHRAMRCKR